MNATHAEDTRADGLRWLGLVLVFAPLLVRATSTVSSLPAWDLDPTSFGLRSPSIGPAGSMLVDVIVLLGVAAIFVAEVLARRPVMMSAVVLGAIGTVMLAAHGWILPGPDCSTIAGSLGNQRVARMDFSDLGGDCSVAWGAG